MSFRRPGNFKNNLVRATIKSHVERVRRIFCNLGKFRVHFMVCDFVENGRPIFKRSVKRQENIEVREGMYIVLRFSNDI